MQYKNLIIHLLNSKSKFNNINALEDIIDQIKGKMVSENALDYSNHEIERCLGGCVLGHILIPLTKELVTQNRIK